MNKILGGAKREKTARMIRDAKFSVLGTEGRKKISSSFWSCSVLFMIKREPQCDSHNRREEKPCLNSFIKCSINTARCNLFRSCPYMKLRGYSKYRSRIDIDDPFRKEKTYRGDIST